MFERALVQIDTVDDAFVEYLFIPQELFSLHSAYIEAKESRATEMSLFRAERSIQSIASASSKVKQRLAERVNPQDQEKILSTSTMEWAAESGSEDPLTLRKKRKADGGGETFTAGEVPRDQTSRSN
jgi:hypothetical protein